MIDKQVLLQVATTFVAFMVFFFLAKKPERPPVIR